MTFDRAEFYDAELRRHDEHFRAALAVGPRDRVLDIGCGAGRTALEAARRATDGSVVGVDVLDDMLDIARRRGADEGVGNVTFERADAQVQPFPAAHFDLCISRFGTMFFADPVAAFANIGRAIRPGGRLVLLVWQGRERNEWATAIQGVLGLGSAQGPAFSLGDRVATTRLLAETGFVSIDFAEVHEPVFYGASADAAYEAIVALFLTKEARAEKAADGTLESLRALLEAHETPGGVVFDSRAWIVTARREP